MTPRALLVHGLASHSGSWWRVADALADEGWEATTIDLRGHGGTPPGPSHALVDYADDVAAAPGPWDALIGHSLGGAAAVVAAARDAGLTRRLVLLDPVLHIDVADRDAILASELGDFDLDASALAHAKPHWHERDRAEKLAGLAASSRTVVQATLDDTGEWDIRADAARLAVDTLVVRGDPSVYSMMSDATVAELTAANPRVRVVEVRGAGHSPHRDEPAATLAAILGFLADG